MSENGLWDIQIRSAGIADLPALVELAEQLGYPSLPGEIEKRLEYLTGRMDHQVFVAQEAAAGVVGWIHVIGAYHLILQPSAELGGLVVRDGWRRRGIGKQLLERAEGWAREHGYGLMRVNSNTARPAAPGFYESMGYARVKTQNVFYKPLVEIKQTS